MMNKTSTMPLNNLILFWYHNGYRIPKWSELCLKKRKNYLLMYSVFDLDFFIGCKFKICFLFRVLNNKKVIKVKDDSLSRKRICYQKGLGFLGGIKSKITKKTFIFQNLQDHYDHIIINMFLVWELRAYQVIQHDFQKRFYGISLHRDCSMSKKWVYV